MKAMLARARGLRERARQMSPAMQSLCWALAAGIQFSLLNTIARKMTLELPPMQAQFLRYLMGLLVMLPLVWRAGMRAFTPNGLGGQLWRGVVHTAGLMLWFSALPHIPLATMTALGFTTPIFIMVGAAWLLHEKISGARWVAALIGFSGVLVVVAPRLTLDGGFYTLVMLASSPVFAASFLITKALTKRDNSEVIVVWQSITVSLFTLPLALYQWQWPTPVQWMWFAIAGVFGSAGHYSLTQSYRMADISATQSVRFLDLIWASLLGLMVFGDVPSEWSLAGGLIIFASTFWITRREARPKR
ncbi:EamA family transporter [Quisquiliibacterium transsilvanicum]|uniref:Drug/metabolite transporter (DMT)-like permease n=2 Tax=Quisquiliibacterium transsilvanicum TaxID=1549638 RepID=A0A7W8HDU0_9BURK|nr:drug/metabolite transporter (DMT)-like permease [Quisquiliibacterium transsilvanicum]